ncbi:662_t:CDS:2 [Cetraspora pellucida]|uniref:662_t:CDS:1 n=1 Tax=Cetraspora pellucida TaxID=1433469 RepID=A0ACA9LPV1_9GLOM|nr:662_t:CDS:2 [Cetraspora pellucida]
MTANNINEINLNDITDDNKINIEKYFEEACHRDINVEELFTNPFKQNPNNYIYMTMLKDEHNYDMCSEALQFEKNKAFTKEMQEDVKFYINQCYFDATLIRKVLKQKYPSHSIFSKDLYKEISKHKPSVQVNEDDTSRLYEEL